MMAKQDYENKAERPVFHNSIAERLSRTSPALVIGVYVPLVIILLWAAARRPVWGNYGLWAWYAAGIVAWTFLEYVMHRFIFHAMEHTRYFHKTYQYIHGFHHEHPKDPKHLFMPIPVGLGLLLFFLLIFSLLLGWYAMSFVPGLLTGYLIYTLGHYSMHRYAPPFEWLKPVWRHHQLHHYRTPERAFGVSNRFWDRVFGTMPGLPDHREATGVKPD